MCFVHFVVWNAVFSSTAAGLAQRVGRAFAKLRAIRGGEAAEMKEPRTEGNVGHRLRAGRIAEPRARTVHPDFEEKGGGSAVEMEPKTLLQGAQAQTTLARDLFNR